MFLREGTTWPSIFLIPDVIGILSCDTTRSERMMRALLTVPLVACMLVVRLDAQEPATRSAHKFTIHITETKFGFTDKGGTYWNNMPAKEFFRTFGPADREEPSSSNPSLKEAHYPGDGIIVDYEPDGAVRMMSFYFIPLKTLTDFRPCDAVTDKGIGSESTPREVLRAYGSPVEDTKDELRNFRIIRFDGFMTTFLDNRLQSISFSRRP